MLPQRPGERARAPDKDAAIPVVIARGHKLFRTLLVWFFSEALYAEEL